MNNSINSVFEKHNITCPYLRQYIMEFTYTNYKKNYDNVVRDIAWVAGDIACNMIDEPNEDIRTSSIDNFELCLREINPKVFVNRRFYQWAKKFKYY